MARNGRTKKQEKIHILIHNVLECFYAMCLYCERVCVCLRPSTVKASSVWNSWNASKQINDVMLKTCISSAKSLHRYFRVKLQTFQTRHFILFTHQQRAEPRLNQCASRFLIMGPSFTIIRRRLRSALHCQPICLRRLHLQEGPQSNYDRLK